MPKTSNKDKEEVVEVEESTTDVDTNTVNVDINKELSDTKKKNEELSAEIENMKKMMDQLLADKNNKTEEKQKDKEKDTKDIILEKYKNIDPNERVLLMNMVNAGATYVTTEGHPVRFDFFGQIQPIKFRDLENLVSKYLPYFKDLEIRILNDDVIDALYLRKDYNKNDITKEDLEGIIDLEPQAMIEKIKSLPKALQESVLSLIVQRASENDSRYLDMNKWAVIKSFANVDIANTIDLYRGAIKGE